MKNKKAGNASLEACIVMPLAVLFIAAMLIVNIKFYNLTDEVTGTDYNYSTKYANISRIVRVIFETGGDIYDLFFG